MKTNSIIATQGNPVSRRAERNSNLELFRIITMLMIIAHHYVVNSGLTSIDGPIQADPTSLRSIITLLVGSWGKIGINCFVFITGYFMCRSHISARKFIKLFMQIEFYNVVIYLVFMFAGYEPFSITNFVLALVPVRDISTGFSSAFIMFYLCIPFINALIHNISERMHLRLISLCALIYMIPALLPKFSVSFNYVSWFIVLYLISSYIRLYPKKFFENQKLWKIMMLITITLSCLSVIGCTFLGEKVGKFLPFYFIIDSNQPLATITAFSAFMCFKNLNIKTSHFINTVSSTTFGILLIHANSDAMRQWLWYDLLKNVYAFSRPWFLAHMICSILGIFIICAAIDLIRIHLLEKPFLKHVDKRLPTWTSFFLNAENTFLKKLHLD